MSRYRSPNIDKNSKRNVVGILLIGLALGVCGFLILVIANLRPSAPVVPDIDVTNIPDINTLPDVDPTIAALSIDANLEANKQDSSTEPNTGPKTDPVATPTPEPTATTALPAKTPAPKPTAKTAKPQGIQRNALLDSFDPLKQSHFKQAFKFLKEGYFQQSSEYLRWVELILKSIAINHGKDVSTRFKFLLSGQTIGNPDCVWAIGTLLTPTFSQRATTDSLSICAGRDRIEMLKFLTIKAIQSTSSNSWRSFIRETLNKFPLNEKRSVKSLAARILVTDDLRGAVPLDKRNLLADQLPTTELVEVFEHVAGLERTLSRRIAELIEKNELIPYPRNLILRPFQNNTRVFIQLRVKLANSLRNEVDPDIVELIELLPSEAASDLLMALCATSSNSEVLDKIYTSFGTRSVPRPTKDLLKIIASERTRARNKILPSICLSSFYSKLPPKDRKRVILQFGDRVNNDKFVEHILESNSKDLIKDFTLKHGKNFGLHILKRLEKYPEPDVRRAAKKYLEWYRR